MLKSDFINITVAPCLSNTELLHEYYSEFLDSLQFEDGTWTIQEFKKLKEKTAGLKEEFEEEKDDYIRDMIIFEDYYALLNSISPNYSSFCCHEGDGSHGFWAYFDEFEEEFPENLLEELFCCDYRELETQEDFESCKGYDFSQFQGQRIVYIESLDALFVCRDGVFTKI